MLHYTFKFKKMSMAIKNGNYKTKQLTKICKNYIHTYIFQ